jgi:hypothetical protein
MLTIDHTCSLLGAFLGTNVVKAYRDVVTSIHPVSHKKLDPRMIKPFDPGVSAYSQPFSSMLDEREDLLESSAGCPVNLTAYLPMRGGVYRRPVYVLDVKRLVDYIFRVILPIVWPNGLLSSALHSFWIEASKHYAGHPHSLIPSTPPSKTKRQLRKKLCVGDGH